MWKLPSGYTVFGTSSDGNQLTARKGSSSAAKPQFIIIDRKEAVYNVGSQRYSVPEFRVRVYVGTVNSEGVPQQERLIAEAVFRTPVGTDADQSDWFADFKAIVNDADFLSDGIQGHLFPNCCAETSE